MNRLDMPPITKVSVVIPVYNEEDSLPELIARTTAACDRLTCDYEILLVDDGSSDRSATLMIEAAEVPGSRVIAVETICAGERVGYGGVFVAKREMRLGIDACGYADGYPRHAPTGTPILVDGQRTRTLGRVSMDMLACDLSDLPTAGRGSEVILWGEGLPVEEVAAAAGTISYELLCALAPRVPVVEI